MDRLGKGEIEVKRFMSNEGSGRTKLGLYISEEMMDRICENLVLPNVEKNTNITSWIGNPSGNFTVKLGWELLRIKKEVNGMYRKIWVKGLPFKVSFLI